MTSKERILCTINGQSTDHIPLTARCFGFESPRHLRWSSDGTEVKYWYSMRLEHIHTLPQKWTLEDDFKRVLAWFSIGIDDILDVSIPWDSHPGVTFTDKIIPPGGQGGDWHYPVLSREYQTPDGPLLHKIKKTADEPEGWPIQPLYAAIFEDFNVARGVKHLVTDSEDIKKIKYLFLPPGVDQKERFYQHMQDVKQFADQYGVFVQAWSAFGMDAVIWLTGVENAVLMALNNPESFNMLINIVAETDYARTELALKSPGIDMICQRGWYSSIDFWSPDLFDMYVIPHLKRQTELTHQHGKKFAYVMTTGVDILGPRLVDAGVDVLYFIDPLMDNISLIKAKELFENRITMVGGINSLSLKEKHTQIRDKVREAIEILGSTGRFILNPVDSIFPDTPWEGVEALIDAWKEYW